MLYHATPRLLAAMGMCAVGIGGGTQALAQTTLGNVVAGASANQGTINTANAIQHLCKAMSFAGYGASVGTVRSPTGASTADENLFLRCNELVQTANVLANLANNNRDLGYGGAGLAHAVQQISGEQVGSQGTLAVRVPSGQFTNIGARLSSLRFSAATGGLFTAQNDDDAPTPTRAAFDAFHHDLQSWNVDPGSQDAGVRLMPASLRTYDVAAADTSSSPQAADSYKPSSTSPFGWFTEGGYGFGHRDETVNEDAFRFDSYSVTVGMDYNFGNAVVGASVGYDRYTADFNAQSASVSNPAAVPGGSSAIDGYSGSVFAAWFDQHWMVNGIASYGVLRTDLTRVVDYANNNVVCLNCGVNGTVALRGNPDGHFIAAGVTVGYDFNLAGINVSPSVSGNYRRAIIDQYSESDPTSSGLALGYDSQTIESLRSIVGVNFSRSLSEAFGVLTPSFKAEWHHEFKDDARSVEMRYATVVTGVTGNFGFAVPTDKPESDYGVVGLGLTSLFQNRLQGYLVYERLVGIPYLKANSISLGLRGQF